MLVLCSALYYFVTEFAAAAPLSHPTGDSEPSYVPNPGGRGTLNILLSSIITLTLCVYTSIHLNITPEKKYFGIQRVWIDKFYWVLIALVAPEFVLYAAYVQFRNAQELCKELKKLDSELAASGGSTDTSKESTDPVEGSTHTIDELTLATGRSIPNHTQNLHPEPAAVRSQMAGGSSQIPSTTQSLEHLNRGTVRRWSDVTMVSAFFIVMGGFAFDVPHHPAISYVALTPEGFLNFARRQFIMPNILNNKEIADRSKADSLAKFLVCVQAMWMVVNCIARKASGLPTTLVELNVVVHVVVAVAVYVLWWHKPLAVAHPIILTGQSFSGTGSGAEQKITAEESRVPSVADFAVALWLLVSNNLELENIENISDQVPQFTPQKECEYENFLHIQPYIPDASRFVIRGNPSSDVSKKDFETRVVALKAKCHPGSHGMLLLSGQTLMIHRTRFSARARNYVTFLTKEDLEFLELGLSFMTLRQMTLPSAAYLDGKNVMRSFLTTDPSNFSVQGSIYFGSVQDANVDDFIIQNQTLLLMCALLSCAYAGCHATAWSSHFPSNTERWIWRGSCMWIAAGFPCASVSLHVFDLMINKLPELLLCIIGFGYCALYMLGIALYGIARLFIVVEAFISIRSLPIGSFKTVNWLEYWPHVWR